MENSPGSPDGPRRLILPRGIFHVRGSGGGSGGFSLPEGRLSGVCAALFRGEASVWPNPLEDYESAAEMIRRRAGEWKVCEDRMVVIGFSAGGHLAACAATMAEHRPNAAILGYPSSTGNVPGISEDGAGCDRGGEWQDLSLLCICGPDGQCGSGKNTLHFLAALEENDVAFESHIYSNGPHGFPWETHPSGCPPQTVCSRVPHWVADSLEWLKDVLGDFGDGQMTEPRFGGRINGNHDPYLNIDCTLGFLFSKPEAMAIAAGVLSRAGRTDAGDGSDGSGGDDGLHSKYDPAPDAGIRQSAGGGHGSVPDQTERDKK